MSREIDVEILVVGGGVGGLWLLSLLRELGYHALLVEGETLGGGQTNWSHGIIHGGVSHAITGVFSDSSKTILNMPQRWQASLEGELPPNLSGAHILAPCQYLWTGGAFTSRLAGFFASKALRGRIEAVAAEELPPVMQKPEFGNNIYRLNEPVLDVDSVIHALAEPLKGSLLKNNGPVLRARDNSFTLTAPGKEPITLRPRLGIFCAGSGNSQLGGVKMQIRPVHVVLARGSELDGGLYAHCLSTSEIPRLSVTSHRDKSGRIVWALGGQLGETGVKRSAAEQIAAARAELTTLMPWVDLSKVEFSAHMVDRAEAVQHDKNRPEGPDVKIVDGMITAWPTKFALVPMMVDQILELLPPPSGEQVDASPELGDWPAPEITPRVWDTDIEWS